LNDLQDLLPIQDPARDAHRDSSDNRSRHVRRGFLRGGARHLLLT
jgi:hypothetical protein